MHFKSVGIQCQKPVPFIVEQRPSAKSHSAGGFGRPLHDVWDGIGVPVNINDPRRKKGSVNKSGMNSVDFAVGSEADRLGIRPYAPKAWAILSRVVLTLD